MIKYVEQEKALNVAKDIAEMIRELMDRLAGNRTPQKTLEDSIERMNIWCEKHPSGVLTLTARGARLRVVPKPNGWLLKDVDSQGRATLIAAYPQEDLQLLVHKILRWSWDHPFKE